MIREMSPAGMIGLSCTALGLPQGAAVETLIAGLLRRTASILCPCPRATLAAAVRSSLRFLIADAAELDTRIEDSLEGLIFVGDLLELHQVSVEDTAVKATWVFVAPPAYVERPGGSIFITGIAAHGLTPLPASLTTRVRYERYTRVIIPDVGEICPAAAPTWHDRTIGACLAPFSEGVVGRRTRTRHAGYAGS